MPTRTTVAPPIDPPALTDPYQAYPATWTAIATLHPHPRNYRAHPADQLAHLQASIQAHGFYRNIVVAQDSTILAGHGVVQAAAQLGYTQVPVIRLPLAPDDERAIQILVGDNEQPRLSMNDEQVLAALLTELQESDPALLLGTGFDETSLGLLLATQKETSPQAPEAFASYDDDIETAYCCPQCGYEWSGKPK